jgi:hypothetical protein
MKTLAVMMLVLLSGTAFAGPKATPTPELWFDRWSGMGIAINDPTGVYIQGGEFVCDHSEGTYMVFKCAYKQCDGPHMIGMPKSIRFNCPTCTCAAPTPASGAVTR